MENQDLSADKINTPNAATTPLNAENVSTAQEVSSTTHSVEVTKRSLRVDTWRKIQANKSGDDYRPIFNRIPGFVDNEKAATLLSETDEFKKAQNIKLNIDRVLNPVKLQALAAGKNLFLPGTRDSTALYLQVVCPADATDEVRKEILQVQDMQNGRKEIDLENKVKFDMVVIGSVVVSSDGYRIGRGNGFADLDIGILIEIGSITPDTIIVTMVHDLQVVDVLPNNLFQKYDTPVDMIVTPTKVIRVTNRLPRPAGIFWNLLSERRLKIIPVLQTIRVIQENSGKVITLKEENTDVESGFRHGRGGGQRKQQRRRTYRPRNNARRAVSHTDTEHPEEDKPQTQKRNTRLYGKFGGGNRRKRSTRSEGDRSQSAAEGKERKQKPHKKRLTRDFCVKLSNIGRDIRVKDLKAELRKRECNPVYISWKGQYGKCYLHFANRDGVPSSEADVEKVLKSLSELSLTANANENSAATRNGGVKAVEGGDAPAKPDEAADAATDATTDAATIIPNKTYSLIVELMKFEDKSKAAGAGNNNNTKGGVPDVTTVVSDAAAATAVNRIESVDTTTV